MMDEAALQALRDGLEAGGQLPAVSVADLKCLWDALPRFQAQSTGPKGKLEDLLTPKANAAAVLARTLVFAALIQKGIPVNEALFEKAATAPLNKDNIEEFMRSFFP